MPEAGEAAMAASGLASFYQSLADDGTMLAEFRADPEATVMKSGLSSRNQQLVLHGDLKDIKAAVASELGDHESLLLVIVIIVNK